MIFYTSQWRLLRYFIPIHAWPYLICIPEKDMCVPNIEVPVSTWDTSGAVVFSSFIKTTSTNFYQHLPIVTNSVGADKSKDTYAYTGSENNLESLVVIARYIFTSKFKFIYFFIPFVIIMI